MKNDEKFSKPVILYYQFLITNIGKKLFEFNGFRKPVLQCSRNAICDLVHNFCQFNYCRP